AEIYYASVGQNWERAAMIKARPVASDPVAAAGFMATIRSFVWRRSLDFAAIQDIHSVKRQIHAHKGHRVPAVNGHDIKLGRGGIREIEFFIQTQQLIHGGRDDRLRVAQTCAALTTFAGLGRIGATVAAEMIAAYRFLRQVEHRLQMIDDRQTHQLPKTDEEVAQIALFLGYEHAAEFRDALLGHLMRVEGHYADLFEEAPSLAAPGNLMFTGTDDDPGTIETLRGLGFGNPSAVIATVAGWHRGRYRCMRNARARELLTELTPALLLALGQTHQPDEALGRFDEFMSRLPSGIQLFSLFYANPRLLGFIAEVMGTAPQLARWLSGKPALLDAMVAPDYFDPLPGKPELLAEYRRAIAEAGNFEDVLNQSRRWVQDQSFRAGVHILRAITDGDRCGPFLSALADIVLDDLARRVEDDFVRRFGRIPGGSMAIIAMGKLGSGQMTIASDLDLITVYQVPPEVTLSDGPRAISPSEYYIKLTQRLIGVITAPTAEGRLYEVDMRLRPSGNAGPVAISLNAFARYQEESAWTWEHMALTRARIVSGAPALRQQLEQVIRSVLTRHRDPLTLVLDVADMRRRIDREHATKNPWEVKYARGGFIDINFVAQYLMLRHARQHPEVIRSNTVHALEALRTAGALEPTVADDLITVHRTWRRVQGFLRLTTGGGLEPNDAPGAIQAALGRCVFPEQAEPVPFRDTDARVRELAAIAYQHFQALIDEPAEQEHLTRRRNQVPPD
ncbi:MAG: bifunctional [glutamine synthetase] adenylyltransferase/[glutamine synthetase]-adenylyl-L-tyrosine phosphorylase, partial [Rhodospirillaceae bacterium]